MTYIMNRSDCGAKPLLLVFYIMLKPFFHWFQKIVVVSQGQVRRISPKNSVFWHKSVNVNYISYIMDRKIKKLQNTIHFKLYIIFKYNFYILIYFK